MSRFILSRFADHKATLAKLLARSCYSLILVSAATVADSKTPKLHGYINQGIIKTSDNSYFGDSEDYSTEFTSVALGSFWRPTPKLQLAAQAIYRQAGATSRDDVYIDYALIDYTFVQEMSWQAGIRAGRIKNPYGFHNETRDVTTTRPSILLPESVYRNSLRDVVHTSDSISVYGHTYIGEHLLQLDLLKGNAIIKDSTKNEFLTPPLQGDLDDEEIEIARLMLEAFGGRLRLAYSYADVWVDFEPRSGSLLGIPLYGFPGKARVTVETSSVEVNLGRWQFSAEHQEFDLKTQGILFPATERTTSSGGFYAGISYQLNSDWHLYLRRDVLHKDLNDKDGRDYSAVTGFPNHNEYAYDWTLGVRYQHDKNWLISAEIHDLKGSGWLSRAENDLSQAEKDWTLLAAQISYQF